MNDPDSFRTLPALPAQIARATEQARAALEIEGVRVRRLVVAFEIEHEALGPEPLRTATSWPEGELREGASLAAEGAQVLRMSDASRRAGGHG